MKTLAMYKRYENVKPIGNIAFCNTFGCLFFEPDEVDKYKQNCDIIAAWFSIGYENAYCFHKHMIHYTTSGKPYIRKGNIRIYLDEVMRV